MKNANITDRAIRRLEMEITSLQDEQTALLRKKFLLEDELREKKRLIEDLQLRETEAREGKKAWQKAAALLVAVWVVVLSFFGIEKK